MTTITLRIDSDLKHDIQIIAKSLGLSLNQLLNLKIRELRDDTEIRVPLKNTMELEYESFSKEENKSLWEKSKNNITNIFKTLDSQLWE